MDRSVKDRLKEFIKSEGLAVQKFEKLCGFSNGYVRNMQNSLGAKKLECILTHFPHLNKDWLLYGKGSMTISEQEQEHVTTSTAIASAGIAVYDIDATCGAESRTMDFADERIIGRVDLPYLSTDTKIVRANGESMLPTIADGDWVAVREVHSWDDIFYGQIYLVITEDYRMLKRIRKYVPDEQGKVILRSDNSEYDDMTFSRDRIKRLYIVVDILSVRKFL